MEIDFTQSFPSIACRYPDEFDLFGAASHRSLSVSRSTHLPLCQVA